MQTFLPYPDFARSARALDWRRLGKQRVECHQIMIALTPGYQGGWVNHPATRMWRGFEKALGQYQAACIREWIARGYKNTMAHDIQLWGYATPPWLGDPEFHASHRSNLLRKDPAHYGQFGWSEPPDLEYVWPV